VTRQSRGAYLKVASSPDQIGKNGMLVVSGGASSTKYQASTVGDG
jgi:hypothetical protein